MSGLTQAQPFQSPRPWPLLLGVTALLCAWFSPLPALASASFSAHMTMHVLVVAVAPPLLVLGLAASRWDPVTVLPAWFAPLPAALVDWLVIWAWHTPVLHHAARASPQVLAAEQASFLAAGLFVWLAAMGGDRRGDPARVAAGIVSLLITSMHMTLLGALLTLSPRVLYGHADSGAAVMGAALDDLNFGGMIMLFAGGLVYLCGALYLLAVLLRPGTRRRP